MTDFSNPMPSDLDPESLMDNNALSDSDASDLESENDLAVEHYVSVG